MSERMFQFFSYYGAKMRAAKKYPKPTKDLIIEPFAGSAGYSTHYSDKKVVLCDLSKDVYLAWKFLITSTKQDILDLPLLEPRQSLTTLSGLDDGARAFIGFWLFRASSTPRDTLASWAEKWPTRFWGKEVREKISNQVEKIKHWEVLNCSYEDLDNIEATWFVDPPYYKGGHYYKHSFVDYQKLSSWCQTRLGQTIVCETDGADWLPFEPLYSHKGIMREERKEVVWLSK